MRTFQSIQQPANIRLDHLPIDRPVGNYYRQSSAAQVGNVSTEIQTVDMLRLLRDRGWAEDQILLIDADAGVSGTLKIDERKGMAELFRLIIEEKIGAVACQDEDRLFRDVTQIQVNLFIDACLSHKVYVITPSIIYIFHHPTMGDFFKRQFRMKCEMAAEYLNVLKSKLGGARDHLRREGKFAGGRVPLGYMVDADEDSAHYRRLICWPEMAAITQKVFETFIECDGHAYQTARTLHEKEIRFPVRKVPPKGYSYPWQGNTKSGYLTPSAIRGMMTNPVYLGHWMYKGAVIRWNNHEAIIAEDLFVRAFNYVSAYNLDGQRNPYYNPTIERIHVTKQRPERPLLTGLAYIRFEDKWRRLGAAWNYRQQHYNYSYTIWRDKEKRCERRASHIDEVVEFHLLERLKEVFDPERFRQAVETQERSQQQDLQEWTERLASLQQQRENILNATYTAQSENFILELEHRFEAVEAEITRSKAKLQEIHVQHYRVTDLMALKDIYLQAIESWPESTRDEKRQILRRMVDRVQIPEFHGKLLEITICWRDGTESSHQLHQHRGQWNYSQQVQLMRMVEQECSRADYLKVFPNKSWDAIRFVIKQYQLPRWNNMDSESELRLDSIIPILPSYPLELLFQ